LLVNPQALASQIFVRRKGVISLPRGGIAGCGVRGGFVFFGKFFRG
jgi:hypothetical protein